MLNKYDGLAKIIVNNVGGKGNIISLTHCASPSIILIILSFLIIFIKKARPNTYRKVHKIQPFYIYLSLACFTSNNPNDIFPIQ